MRKPVKQSASRSLKRGALACLSIVVVAPALAGPTPDCTCRAKNVVAREGETVCLTTPNGGKLAVCQKVLNNTSWKFLPGSCSNWVTQTSRQVSPTEAIPSSPGGASSPAAYEVIDRL